MKKYFLVLLAIFSVQFLTAQTTLEIPKKNTQKGFLQLDYMSVNMVDKLNQPEENMGFSGIHYNLWLNDNLYTGGGFYGTVSGKRGGLFTLGLNFGAKYTLKNNLFVDLGLHFGAGGGAGAPDGGGAMILPHINFGYEFGNFSTSIGWSYVNFFDEGLINSHQANISIQIPLTYDYSLFNNREKSYATSILKPSNWNQKTKRLSLMLHQNNLSPFRTSKLTNGSTLFGKTIRLAGFEINSYFTDNWFTFFRADGAFDGIKGGYMDILFGGGYHFSFNKNRTNILTKFGIGAGGGGGVDSAGGFFIYPDISIEQKLFDDIYFAVNKGILMNPDNHFGSSTLGFALKYYINQSGIKSDKNYFTTSKIKGLEVIFGQDIYFNAERDKNTTEHLYQLGLQINVFLNNNIYVVGETSFANFGNAGAYAEGIVGFGYRTNDFLNNKMSFFVQGLAGAAGGGDISTGQGLIFKPGIGFNYKINDLINFRTEGGYVKAKGGILGSTYANFGISYEIGSLISK